MSVEIKVPTLGESVTEATIAKWLKQTGDTVAVDEPLVELETDKVSIEVNAPVAGVMGAILCTEGADVAVGTPLGILEEGAGGDDAPTPAPASAPAPAPAPAPTPAPTPAPASAPAPAPTSVPVAAGTHVHLSPAVRRLVSEHGLDPALIPATGPGSAAVGRRLTKGDVYRYLQGDTPARAIAPTSLSAQMPPPDLPPRKDDPREEVVRMSKLRKVVARRLKEAQNTAAMLTTWNEVDMSVAMKMRGEYKDNFEKKHGVRLGFMSMFIRASITALKELPAVNAEIYGTDIIYKNYYNIGVAVGSPQGLVVPVLKDADEMSFVDMERSIADFGRRARDGKLSMDEMTGGTFTISNGGVFGSLMSMPILNVPQSAILGMHKIQRRPVAVGDEIVIRPMMYLALTYDHRIIDGREAVMCLVRIKECIEDPKRLLLDV